MWGSDPSLPDPGVATRTSRPALKCLRNCLKPFFTVPFIGHIGLLVILVNLNPIIYFSNLRVGWFHIKQR